MCRVVAKEIALSLEFRKTLQDFLNLAELWASHLEKSALLRGQGEGERWWLENEFADAPKLHQRFRFGG
jgi:hypothetical protein